jgi:hypothetical protein
MQLLGSFRLALPKAGGGCICLHLPQVAAAAAASGRQRGLQQQGWHLRLPRQLPGSSALRGQPLLKAGRIECRLRSPASLECLPPLPPLTLQLRLELLRRLLLLLLLLLPRRSKHGCGAAASVHAHGTAGGGCHHHGARPGHGQR